MNFRPVFESLFRNFQQDVFGERVETAPSDRPSNDFSQFFLGFSPPTSLFFSRHRFILRLLRTTAVSPYRLFCAHASSHQSPFVLHARIDVGNR